MVSLHGMHVHGFPNLFVVGPNQAGNLISNIPHNLVEAARTIAAIVGHATELGATEVETTAEAEDEWMDKLMAAGRTFGGSADCTPGYYNNEGQPSGIRGLRNMVGYPDGPVAYFAYIDRWRTDGRFEGLDFRSRAD
jgi:cyclohexanone monooxygenase